MGRITYKDLNTPAFMPASQDQTLDFVYDAYGNRTKKSLNGADATYYINDGLTVLNELDSAGNVNKTMVRGLDPVVEIDKNGIISYIHSDILGSTVMMTNEQGDIVRQYEYDPFGQLITDIGDTDKETKYTYTGQESDPESELSYYNARYYNPRLGRFISRDVMLGKDGDTLSRNLYIYVKNNPLKYTDPTGNTSEAVKKMLWLEQQQMINTATNNSTMMYSQTGAGQSQILETVFNAPSYVQNFASASADTFYAAQNDSYQKHDYIGGFVQGMVANFNDNLATALDPHSKPGTALFAGGMVGVDLATLGSGSFEKQGLKEGITVLGKYPDYVNLASKLEANMFNIPKNFWNKMTSVQQWEANTKFLDRAIGRGDKIILSNGVTNLNEVTGTFRKELDYLIGKGYKLINNGLQMIK